MYVKSPGGKPSGPEVELRSATGHQFTTTDNTTICLRTRDGINVAKDFQIASKDTVLQRSIISVGQVCDRGNIIAFRRVGGTILNEFTGECIEFERCWWRISIESRHGLMGSEQDTAGAAEAQPARPGHVPVLPSGAEVEQHELTHLPFRNWCRHCVRAKSEESPHHEASPGGVSKFATDYMFMGEDATPITLLAGYDGLTKAFFANVVLCKGTSHGYAERALHRSSESGTAGRLGTEHPNRNRVRRKPTWKEQRQRQHRASKPNHPRTDPCNQGLHRTTNRCDKWS